MKYKLLVTDLDGTMLNSKCEISKKNMEAVEELRRQGGDICVASGRLKVDALKFARKLGCSNNFNIANSGLTIFNEESEKIIARFETKFYQRLVDILRYNHIQYVAITSDDQRAFYDKENESFKHLIRRVNTDTSMEFCETDTRNLKHVFKVYSNYTNVDHIFLHQEISRLHKQISTEVSGDHFIDLSPRGVTKWSGILKIAEEMNISTDEIVAVGDQENDMRMVDGVGLGVAVNNAIDGVKSVADVVLPYTNDEDAIYHLIHDYMLD